ncbi:MAG: hypothetical protein EBT22_13470 [Chloroflexi bacterium]|nr:hypothetical protein [Chloroflexota bacterium]
MFGHKVCGDVATQEGLVAKDPAMEWEGGFNPGDDMLIECPTQPCYGDLPGRTPSDDLGKQRVVVDSNFKPGLACAVNADTRPRGLANNPDPAS